jgi:uncharacterized membrane protein
MDNKHPVVEQHKESTKNTFSLRIADKITAFAGSMGFVYIHIVVFGIWMGSGFFGLDKFPFGFLTMIVSLEAIFLSTFVMIAQNRQSAFAEAKADHEYEVEYKELQEITALTKDILKLTNEVHKLTKHVHEIQTQFIKHVEES